MAKVLDAHGWNQWIVAVFLIKPLAALFAPLAISAQADQRMSAEKILAGLLLVGAVLQVLAFRELQLGGNPWRFLAWYAIQSLITAPTFALLNAITFAYLDGEVNRFGGLRVWGTMGWIAAGWLVSLCRLDASAAVGYLAAGSSLIAVAFTLTLPSAMPLAAPATSWADRLGLSALKLLRSRDLGVVVIVSCLFMMPLTAFYMHTPLFLDALGVQRIAATMSLGQLTEVACLFGLGYFLRRFRLRTLLVWGIVFAILRFGLFAVADQDSMGWVLLGIGLHGLCWSLFFEVGRAFVDLRAPTAFRAQVQALVALGTSGLGSLVGTALVGIAYQALVPSGAGWSAYWWLLAAWCVLCGWGFVLVFRDDPQRQPAKACSVGGP